jgi:hypothetical protein
MRTRNTIEFLGICEQPNNPDFNSIEFDGIRNKAGLNSFFENLNALFIHEGLPQAERDEPGVKRLEDK